MYNLHEKLKAKGTAVALGYFDGIHIGHQAVLQKALDARKKGLQPVVMLFDIHPRKLITGKIPPMLMSEEQKRVALEEMGFQVVDFDFKKAMNYSPDEFIEKVLLSSLNAKLLSCGFDYHFGKGGKGDPEYLKKSLIKKGIEVYSLDAISFGDEKVSSTRIRELIIEGKIEQANTMLGKEFSFNFLVEKGDGLGRKLGFPTINQFFPQNFIVPKFGVYASKAKVDGKIYPAVTNIGIRPTVAKASMRSETSILDFSGNLYGKKVEVFLTHYLREEKKFDSLTDLVMAVEKDKIKSRKLYNGEIKA